MNELPNKEIIPMNYKSLEDRMKEYEGSTSYSLEKKVPVIGRVDGKSFSKFTRGLKKESDSPWSSDFTEAMANAAIAGCQEIHGCKMAYFQSDEISFLVTDTTSNNTEAQIRSFLPAKSSKKLKNSLRYHSLSSRRLTFPFAK